MAGFAAGPVLHAGAVTRVMDEACYSQVICIIFTVATKLLLEPLWNAFFPPHFFDSNRSHSVRTHLKLFLLSFVSSLSGMVGCGDWGRLVFDAADPLFPSPHLPSSARWSTFPSECSQAIRLFFPLPPFTVSCSLPGARSPVRWLHVAVHLQAVCGMVLWAGIWQPLIRERVSRCYSFGDVF